jgi:cell division protein FtsA
MNEMTRMSRAAAAPPPAEEPPERPRTKPRQSGPFGVLDIGTSKIVCVIGRIESDHSVRVLGLGWQKGRGVRAGGIVDIEKAERAIRAAVGIAEEEAGTRLSKVIVNLSAGQPESRLLNVQWPVGGRAVNEGDLRRVFSASRTRATSEARSIIHNLPLAFNVDEAAGVIDPRGLFCETLGAHLHVIDAATTSLRSLDACLARCDLEIAELVSAPMAAGLATLAAEERMLGATVLDMGGSSTGLAVFAEGHLLHTAQVPLGGMDVTKAIAGAFSTPIANAERLKTLSGSALPSPDDEREILAFHLVGEEDHLLAKAPRSMLVNIITPQLEKTFEQVRERLDACGLGRAALQRVVLTGGASQLQGVRELATRVLGGGNVRLGRPAPLRGLADSSTGPAFATAAGLLGWAAGAGRAFHDLDPDAERPGGVVRRVIEFLRQRL